MPHAPHAPHAPQRRNAAEFTDHAQVAWWYSQKYLEMGGGWHTPVEELDRHLYVLGLPSDARGMRLVDLGFGDGQLLARAVLSGASCFGVDICEVGYRMALTRWMELDSAHNVGEGALGSMSLSLSPMETTGYPSAHFDFALSLGSMEHALDVEAAVVEMARILKPGGRWLLYVPNEEWAHDDQPLETVAPSSWWVGLCEQAGLVVGNDERLGDNNRITGVKPRDGAQ